MFIHITAETSRTAAQRTRDGVKFVFGRITKRTVYFGIYGKERIGIGAVRKPFFKYAQGNKQRHDVFGQFVMRADFFIKLFNVCAQQVHDTLHVGIFGRIFF